MPETEGPGPEEVQPTPEAPEAPAQAQGTPTSEQGEQQAAPELTGSLAKLQATAEEEGRGSYVTAALEHLQDRADIEQFFTEYVDHLKDKGVPEEAADHQARVNLSHVIGYFGAGEAGEKLRESLYERWNDFLQGSGPDAEYIRQKMKENFPDFPTPEE